MSIRRAGKRFRVSPSRSRRRIKINADRAGLARKTRESALAVIDAITSRSTRKGTTDPRAEGGIGKGGASVSVVKVNERRNGAGKIKG